HVHRLGVVVVGVLVVAEADAAAVAERDGVLAVAEPLDDQLVILLLVVAGAEEAGDGGGGQRRPFPPRRRPGAAAAEAVHHAAALRRRVLQVVLGLADELQRHLDAGVLGGPQRLHLGHGHRALVAVVAVLRRGVVPAALRGLGLADVVHAAGNDVLQLLAALLVALVAVDRRQEHDREAVAVHVAVGLLAVLEVADQPV